MSDAIIELHELNRGYVRAAETSDVRWYAEHLHEAYASSNPDGSLVDRAGFIARFNAPYPGSQLEAVDVQIRLVGAVGIVESGFRYLRPDGQPGIGCYTDAWARTDGRWLCLSAHFVLFHVALRPDAALAPGNASGEDAAMLGALNGEYIRSVRESDGGWFDTHLDAGFVNSNADGTRSPRAAFIEQVSKPCAVANLSCSDVRTTIIGDCAFIRARTHYLKPGGEPGLGRYTDMWMKRGGRWVCVAAHVTRG